MAITRDGTSGNQNAASPFSTSLTIANQTNRILLVSMAGAGSLGTVTITFDGVAMTQINSATYATSRQHATYILPAPAVGTKTLSISWTGGTSSHIMMWWGYGIPQSTTTDAVQNTTGTGTAVTADITTVKDNDWVVSFMGNDGTPSNTGGTNATIQNQNGGFTVADSNAALTPAGSKTTAMTLGASANWSWTQVALAPTINTTVALSQGSFTLTGQPVTFTFAHHYTVALAQGSYTLTGQTLTPTFFRRWTPLTKNTSSFTNGTLHSSAWTNASKDTSTFTNQSKS